MDTSTISGLFLLALAVGIMLALRVRAWIQRRRMQQRFSRGRDGERKAATLLRREGYHVLDEQATRETRMWVDGRQMAVRVRADYVVERGGKKYVVEVKTGKKATNPASTATRRQLLEYERVYNADGLLLADMEQNRLSRVWFEDIPVRKVRHFRSQIRHGFLGVVILLVGMSLGMILYRILQS